MQTKCLHIKKKESKFACPWMLFLPKHEHFFISGKIIYIVLHKTESV